jgi:hypothetical protein
MSDNQPDPEKDRPPIPESEPSLILHVIDEMPFHVVIAVMFVAFFFIWGAVNNAIKLTGRDLASLETPYGYYAGLIAAAATPFIIWRIKRRKK